MIFLVVRLPTVLVAIVLLMIVMRIWLTIHPTHTQAGFDRAGEFLRARDNLPTTQPFARSK